MRTIKTWGTLLLVLVLLIVVLQNTDPVRTLILFFPVDMPLALLLVITILVGVTIGFALGARHRKR